MTHVAREAGVSTQTVSRVLNDRPDVSPETRERIKDIIRKLGYQPNAMARSLASDRTRTLGLITEDFSDYFFTQVIAGAEEEARRHGYLFMLGSTERNLQDDPEYIRLLRERHVDGFLFSRPSTESGSIHIADLIRSGIPVVNAACYFPEEICTVVDIDNVTGGRLAAQHIKEGGHERVATIHGPAGWKSVSDRAKGFMHQLNTYGLSLKPQLVVEGDWSYESGYRTMQQLLSRGESFTALFVHNDQMAIGAMRALRQIGRRVPNDVSVIGYDDIPAAEFAVPPLTTVRQPMRELGAVATRLLIKAIEEGEQNDEEVFLQPELIIRESTQYLYNR
jgi:LacI family transcriptional regulator